MPYENPDSCEASTEYEVKKELRQRDSSKSWTQFFEMLNNQSAFLSTGVSCDLARSPHNRWKNRYRDIIPYDHNRVILLSSIDGDYVNASYVNIPEAPSRMYIMTQGPTQRTASHFWTMVWETRSRLIVMLNRIFEKGTLRCFPYFPSKSGPSFLSFVDASIEVHLEEEKNQDFYIYRKFELRQINSGERHTIIQMHYQHWPDFGVPSSPGKLLNFLWAIRATGGLEDPEHPPVVHCSAGVGRSGAFVLIDLALHMVEEKGSAEQLDLSKLFLDLRRCRMGTIQTPDQLRFSYSAVILAVDHILRTPKDQIPSIKFPMQDENGEEAVESSESDDSWSEQFGDSDVDLNSLLPDEQTEHVNQRLEELGTVRNRFLPKPIEKSRRPIDGSALPMEGDYSKQKTAHGNPHLLLTQPNLIDRSNNALPATTTTDPAEMTTDDSPVVLRRSVAQNKEMNPHGDFSLSTSSSLSPSTTLDQSTNVEQDVESEYLSAAQDLIRRRQIRRERQVRMRERIAEIRMRMRQEDLERRRWLPEGILRLLQRFYVQSGLIQTGYGAVLSTTILILAVVGISRVAYLYWPG